MGKDAGRWRTDVELPDGVSYWRVMLTVELGVSRMADVQDVAAYIVANAGPMSAMKLQKLVYYSQAWHLVWADEPLFDAPIQAWANGPVVYEVFKRHRGQFSVSQWPAGDPGNLTKAEQGTVDAVLKTYASLSGRQLSHLTHSEDPWKNARGELPATAASSEEITTEAMAAYYGPLDTAEDATPVDELDWRGWDLEAEPVSD